MSSLLTLAKDLEQKSREQQHDTAQMLKTAFSEHEAYVSQELNESAKRINGAILDHDEKLASAIRKSTRGMLKTVGRTWTFIVLVSLLLICTSGGILWWQGQTLLNNQLAIQEQADTLTKLNAGTWGVRYQTGENGRRFLVMPEGTKPEVIPYNGTMWIELKQD